MGASPLANLIHRVRRAESRAQVARAQWQGVFVATGALLILATVTWLISTPISPRWVGGIIALVGTIPVARVAFRSQRSDDDIARQIDAKLRLNELMASAISCSNRDDDAARSLLAMANAAAAKVPASFSLATSPSPRAWIAAGLSFIGAIVFAMMIEAKVDPTDQHAGRSIKTAASSVARHDERRSDGFAAAARSTSNTEQRPQDRREPEGSDDASRVDSATDSALGQEDGARSGETASVGEASGRTEDGRVDRRLNFQQPAGSDQAALGAQVDASASTVSTASQTATHAESGLTAEGTRERQPLSAAADNSSSDRIARVGPTSANPTRAPTIPARHRDIVRAYFDANPPATQPASTSR